jgi:hypothetical protein
VPVSLQPQSQCQCQFGFGFGFDDLDDRFCGVDRRHHARSERDMEGALGHGAHPTTYVGTVVIDGRAAKPITLADLFSDE